MGYTGLGGTRVAGEVCLLGDELITIGSLRLPPTNLSSETAPASSDSAAPVGFGVDLTISTAAGPTASSCAIGSLWMIDFSEVGWFASFFPGDIRIYDLAVRSVV